MNKRELLLGLSALPVLAINTAYADGDHGKSEPKDSDNGVHSLQEIKPGFYFLSGEGGNMLLSTGDDGVLLIDAGYQRNAEALHRLINQHGTLKYLINTHWHGDHTGGNEMLGREATIVAHDNVRVRLSSPQTIDLFNVDMPAQPSVALPVISYQQEMTLRFNAMDFNLSYYPDAHTDSDTVVSIPDANIVHTGDLCFAGMFPFIDPGSKGSIRNVIRSLQAILADIDDDTIVVPGHGGLTNKAELKAYVDMLVTSANTVEAFINDGLTLAQMQEKGLPESLVSVWDGGFIKEPVWIQLVMETL